MQVTSLAECFLGRDGGYRAGAARNESGLSMEQQTLHSVEFLGQLENLFSRDLADDFLRIGVGNLDDGASCVVIDGEFQIRRKRLGFALQLIHRPLKLLLRWLSRLGRLRRLVGTGLSCHDRRALRRRRSPRQSLRTRCGWGRNTSCSRSRWQFHFHLKKILLTIEFQSLSRRSRINHTPFQLPQTFDINVITTCTYSRKRLIQTGINESI